MSRLLLRRLAALAARVDERIPVTLAEARTLLERLRYETARAEPPPAPRWRTRLQRELHDEAIDELLGVRRRGRGRL